MKKLILLACIMLSSVCTVSAKVLKVQEGSASCFKEGAAIVEFDCENATWEGKQNYKAWCGEELYKSRNAAALEQFIIGFNAKSKGLKISRDTYGVKYKIIFHVDEFDRFWAPGHLPGNCYGSVSGTLDVFDINTGEKVCSILVKKCNSAGTNFDITKNITDACFNLGFKLAKLKK